jgi:hypothetical protein
MFFLLVTEVLNALIRKADTWSLFQPPGLRSIAFRVSFYVDDLVWFVTPVQHDIQMAHTILSIFKGSSGLRCNLGNVSWRQSGALKKRYP